LRARMTCLEKTASKSKPEIGSAVFLVEAFNQKDELVMRMTNTGIMLRRQPGQF